MGTKGKGGKAMIKRIQDAGCKIQDKTSCIVHPASCFNRPTSLVPRYLGKGSVPGFTNFAFALLFFIFSILSPVLNEAQAAITYEAAGTIAYSANNGTSVAPAYPASIVANDLLVLIIGMKPSSANSGSVTTPTDWTDITSIVGAGGYGATLGADTGNTNVFTYYKVAAGTETGSLTVTIATNNVSWAQIYRLRNATGAWSVAGTTGSDTTGDASVSVVFADNPGVTAGDHIIGAFNTPTDVGGGNQFSAQALSQSGITFGTVTEISEPSSGTGNDIGAFTCQAPVSSGTGSGAPTLTATAGGTVTNVRGPGVFIRARELPVTTLGDGINPSNATIAPGAAITDLDAFTLITSSGTDTITAITVTLGPAGAFNNVGQVDITDNSNVVRCTAVTNPGSNTISFTTCTSNGGVTASTSSATYKVRITPKSHSAMPPPPGASYATTGTVTSFASTNAQAGSDTASATVTIDNLSPNGATAVSGSAGNQNVTINWTASNSADFNTTSGSVIYRWAAGSAGAEVPAEGSTPSIGSANGTATVACVVSSAISAALSKIDGSGGSAECTTTALTNGQQYTYKAFQKDTNGNYDVGVSIGTFTPGVTGPTIAAPTEAGYTDYMEPNSGNTTTAFRFKVVYTNTTGPSYVRICIGDNDDTSSYPCYAMTLDTAAVDPLLRDGIYTNGEQYVYTLPGISLGAAEDIRFYFEASDGGPAVKLPASAPTSYITGPVVSLMYGQNLVGVPKNLSGHSYINVLGDDTGYTWCQRYNSTGLYTGVYVSCTSENIVVGKGYWVWAALGTRRLDEPAGVGNITAASYDIALQVGWNMISNPYNQRIPFQAASGPRVTVVRNGVESTDYTAAVTSNWIGATLYEWQGPITGYFGFVYNESGAALAPWKGYWIYVPDTTFTTMSLRIYK